MPDYRLTTRKTWLETVRDLEQTFDLWGVTDFQIDGRPSQKAIQTDAERSAGVRFFHPSGRLLVVKKSDLRRGVDNLRALYLGLEDMRMMERRGVVDVVRDALLQLEAPAAAVDPWELLGVRPDAPLEIVEAAWRAQAKRLHPDAGGSTEQMQALNDAYAIVRESATRREA